MGSIVDTPAVRLQLESTSEAPSVVRGALSAIGDRASLPSGLLDDLKTAATEACNNVVMHAYAGFPGPLEVRVYLDPGGLEIVVRDHGLGIPDRLETDEQPQGIGIPMIESLAEDAEFIRCEEGGTEVRMRFGRVGDTEALTPELEPELEDDWISQLSGDAVVSLSSPSLLEGVLGRVTRALAAKARFSLDRFSDIFLATDVIATHASEAVAGGRIAFGLSIDVRHLEMTIGPFPAGTSSALSRRAAIRPSQSMLGTLVDRLEVLPTDGSEMLRIVIDESPRRMASAS